MLKLITAVSPREGCFIPLQLVWLKLAGTEVLSVTFWDRKHTPKKAVSSKEAPKTVQASQEMSALIPSNH